MSYDSPYTPRSGNALDRHQNLDYVVAVISKLGDPRAQFRIWLNALELRQQLFRT